MSEDIISPEASSAAESEARRHLQRVEGHANVPPLGEAVQRALDAARRREADAEIAKLQADHEKQEFEIESESREQRETIATPHTEIAALKEERERAEQAKKELSFANNTIWNMGNEAKGLREDIRDLRARLEVVRGALEPFAKAAQAWPKAEYKNGIPNCEWPFQLEALWNAALASEAPDPSDEQIRKEHAEIAAHNEGVLGMPQGPCQCSICAPSSDPTDAPEKWPQMRNYPLFELMSREHGLTLMESELDDIERDALALPRSPKEASDERTPRTDAIIDHIDSESVDDYTKFHTLAKFCAGLEKELSAYIAYGSPLIQERDELELRLSTALAERDDARNALTGNLWSETMQIISIDQPQPPPLSEG